MLIPNKRRYGDTWERYLGCWWMIYALFPHHPGKAEKVQVKFGSNTPRKRRKKELKGKGKGN